MKLMYKGENQDGTICRPCGGRPTGDARTSKNVFGYHFEVGKAVEVAPGDFDKLMATDLFDVV